MPLTENGTVLCITNDGAKSPLPTPTNTPTFVPGSADANDPNGIWWTMKPAFDLARRLDLNNVTSWFGTGGVVSAVRESCYQPNMAAPLTSVNIASFLLETTTSFGSVAAPESVRKQVTPTPMPVVEDPFEQPTSGRAAPDTPASPFPSTVAVAPVAWPTPAEAGLSNTEDPAESSAPAPTAQDNSPSRPQPGSDGEFGGSLADEGLAEVTTTHNALSVLESAASPSVGQDQTNPAPATMANIGDIIASALGMTLQSDAVQEDLRSVVSSADAVRESANTKEGSVEAQNPSAIATAGSQTIIPGPSGSGVTVLDAQSTQVVVAGIQTTVGGMALSVGPANVVLGESTIPMARPVGPAVVAAEGQDLMQSTRVSQGALPIATVGSRTIGADPSSPGIVVVDATSTYNLAPDAQTSIDNVLVSVGSSDIVIDGSTLPVPALTGSQITEDNMEHDPTAIATVDSRTIVAIPSGSGVIVADAMTSYTLTPGALTSIGEVPVSIGAEDIVVGSSTIQYPSWHQLHLRSRRVLPWFRISLL